MINLLAKIRIQHLNFIKRKYSTSFQSIKYKFIEKSLATFDSQKLCLIDQFKQFNFGEILSLSKRISLNLQDIKKSQHVSNKSNDLQSQKIGIYCSNDFSYLVSILAVWMANGVPFCLNKSFPPKFIDYYLNDSGCKLVINSSANESQQLQQSFQKEFDQMLRDKNIFNFKIDKNLHLNSTSDVCNSNNDFENFISSISSETGGRREALLLYTSGTSGPAKGFFSLMYDFYS